MVWWLFWFYFLIIKLVLCCDLGGFRVYLGERLVCFKKVLWEICGYVMVCVFLELYLFCRGVCRMYRRDMRGYEDMGVWGEGGIFYLFDVGFWFLVYLLNKWILCFCKRLIVTYGVWRWVGVFFVFRL